ncbi:anosmin-1-like [Dendronephthya gigantea]|uniref:anosmin-1-like n=1 Tax=Dendronephthya gigantea TaxID=151771 RepID=UPI00106CB194|nr:anosmin-1-like [Dendronephthya gigantea]
MSSLITFTCVLLTLYLSEGTIIYTAQCRSRCHSLYKTRKDQQKLLQCLSPCAQDYAKLGSCRDFCKSWGDDLAAPCHFSCKKYKQIYRDDYGTGKCVSKGSFLDHEYCDRNVRCDELRKCCSKTNNCEDIVVYGEEIKVAVSGITSSSLLARWNESNITNAVYIIQLRELDSKSIYYDDYDWSPWEQIQQGVKIVGVKLTALQSGMRLQIRVAIVNSSGLQSIGPATPVIRTLFNASRPSAPEQIWVMKESFSLKSVSVTLEWKPPAILDVPVRKYRIYWREITKDTGDLAVLTKMHTQVPGSQLNYTIQKLKPDTTYRVEIEAMCLWNKKKLKGPKAEINVSTGHIKDNGKGSIDVYFTKNKTKKEKSNHPPRYYDEIKNINVLVERENGTTATTSPSVDLNKSPVNSGIRRHLDEWLTLTLPILYMLAFWRN